MLASPMRGSSQAQPLQPNPSLGPITQQQQQQLLLCATVVLCVFRPTVADCKAVVWLWMLSTSRPRLVLLCFVLCFYRCYHVLGTPQSEVGVRWPPQHNVMCRSHGGILQGSIQSACFGTSLSCYPSSIWSHQCGCTDADTIIRFLHKLLHASCHPLRHFCWHGPPVPSLELSSDPATHHVSNNMYGYMNVMCSTFECEWVRSHSREHVEW